MLAKSFTQEVENRFNFQNVFNILKKDWIELRHNRQMIITTIFFPVFFSIVFPMSFSSSFAGDTNSPLEQYWNVQAMMGFLKSLFLMIPAIIALRFTADSFAGEKERKTIETLILLPIKNSELFAGKVLFAVLPSIFVGGASFCIMGLVMNLQVYRAELAGLPLLIFGEGGFWVFAFIVSPLLSLVVCQLGTAISARASNVKSAYSLTVLSLLPISSLGISSVLGIDPSNDGTFLAILTGLLLFGNFLIGMNACRILNKERLIACIS